MSSLARWMRRLRTLLWTSFSILVILAAVLVGVGKLVMPYSHHFQPQLEQWLSAELGNQVSFDSFSGQWRAFGPRLTLQGLKLHSSDSGKDSNPVLISQAALDLKLMNLFVPGAALYSFLVIGADLELVQTEQGQLKLSGLGLGGSTPTGLRNFIGLGELRLEDSTLKYSGFNERTPLYFSEINAHLQFDDENIAVELLSKLTDRQKGVTYGQVDLTILAELANGNRLSAARWQFSIDEFSLTELQDFTSQYGFIPRSGTLQASVWGDWQLGGDFSNIGELQLQNLRLGKGDNELKLDRMNTQFMLATKDDENWRLDLQDTQFTQDESSWAYPELVVARDMSKSASLWLGADFLPLQETLQLARQVLMLLNNDSFTDLPTSLNGSLAAVDFLLDPEGESQLVQAEMRNVSVSGWGNRPSISGINGVIALQNGKGNVVFSAPQLYLDWPQMFREGLEFSVPECLAETSIGPAWQILFHGCHLFNEDMSIQGDVRIGASPGRPAVDINLEILRGDIGAVSPYWPQGVLPPRATAWLRANLHDGQVNTGRLQIHGDLDDWPFTNRRGRFEAWADIEDGEIGFAKDWPLLESVTATAHFVGAGMLVEGRAGSFGGVPVPRASARIDSFGSPLLVVDFEGKTVVPEVLQMLHQTPLLSADDLDLNAFSFGGNLNVEGLVTVPLGNTPGKLQVTGEAQLSGGIFEDVASGIKLETVNGVLHFDEASLKSESLPAVFKGNPAMINLQVGGNESAALIASMHGHFDVLDVLPEFLLKQERVLSALSGASEWRANLMVPAKTNAVRAPVQLTLESGLEGITLNLPAPLRKAPAEEWPFLLRYPLSGESRLLEMGLNNQVFVTADITTVPDRPGISGVELPDSADFSIDDNTADVAAGSHEVRRASIRLGEAGDGLPEDGFVQLQGRTSRFDLDDWVDIAIQGAKTGGGLGGLSVQSFTIDAEKLSFLDRLFDEVSLSVALTDTGIRADFEAEDIDGHVLFTPAEAGSNSLNAEFDRLVLAKPESSGIDTNSDPADFPELHLYARSFRYGDLEMGETRVEAYPTAAGFHFEKVEAKSDELSVRASGDWSLQENGQRSDFSIMMTAESLGNLLQSLDISSSMEGGQTLLQFDAWWPGPPAAFALARLNGEIEFSVTRGQITNASAGGGKVLGLLSIQSLPRRLSLDFRDVFDSGFGFETAKGTFRMENGTAYTEDVELTSSAASISLSGSTDLVNQLYNQQMTIRPGVGNTLPVIGALAAGPGGAAAGLALQGLLHEQLGKATQVQYTITGSWEEPLVEPVIKDGQSDSTGSGKDDGNNG